MAHVPLLRLTPEQENNQIDTTRSKTRVRQIFARWARTRATPPERLEQQMAQNRARSPLLCSWPEADYPPPLQGCRGEVNSRAEKHTLKGNTAKLLLTDGKDLNIYHLGAGVRFALFQLRSIDLALQGCFMMNKSEMREWPDLRWTERGPEETLALCPVLSLHSQPDRRVWGWGGYKDRSVPARMGGQRLSHQGRFSIKAEVKLVPHLQHFWL